METYYKFHKNHFIPNDACKYYMDHKYDKRKSIVAVIYPCFNEEYDALERSMISMYQQEKECESLSTEFHYVAILDGWSKASESMKDNMETLFKGNWRRELEESKDAVSTLILQNVDSNGLITNTRINKDVCVKLSVIIKKDNRRKANSHEWFFKTFVNEYRAKYAFATDCGTLYGENCMYNLIDHLNQNPDTQVATGRQRVMSSDMESMSSGGLMSIWYRACQAYDYESSVSSFQGAFSLLGMLPVIPGPCGLYRMDGLQPALDHYFQIVNVGREEIGLLLGNLLLAEDRILSYAAVFFTGRFSKWVPGSVFYFEAETQTKNFIAQRRRWTNGSFAGYIYLLSNIGPVVLKSDHSVWFKFTTIMMLLLQCISFFFATLSPALFASMIYRTILTLNLDNGDTIAVGYLGFYMSYYVVFSLVHHYNKFVPILYNTIFGINALSMLMVMMSIMFNLWNMSTTVLASIIAIICIPFILSLIHSFDVFVMMLCNFIPFMFFIPTFVAWFSAYSMTRISDLSWGNRPSASHKGETKQLEIKTKGDLILIACIFVNLLLAGVFASYDVMEIMFIVITLPTLIQQVFSFLFYMFSSSHLLSGSLLRANKKIQKGFGILMLIVAIGMLIVSVATPDMLETQLSIVENVDMEIVDYSYVYKKDNNLCTGQIDRITAFFEENDETCFYEEFSDNDMSNIASLNILESYNETLDVHEIHSVLDYIATNNPLKHGFQEYYYNTSKIYDNQVLTRIDKSIYTKVHPDSEYVKMEFNSYDPNDIVLERYEKRSEATHTKSYKVLSDDGYVNLRYGILFVDFEYFGAKYMNETVMWGSNILYDWPNTWWTLMLLTQSITIIITSLVLMSIVYSLCIKDKSRVQDAIVMYLWISLILLIVSVMLFPMGLHSMKSFLLGWWDPNYDTSDKAVKLCGETADFFSTGECTVGYSYVLVITSIIPLSLSYNMFKIIAKSNKRKLQSDEAPDEIVIDNVIYVKEKKQDP